MIDHLCRISKNAFVIICEAENQRPTGRERALWLQSIHPYSEVIVVNDLCVWHGQDPCLPECSAKWAQRVESLGLPSIDIVVANEDYGSRFAAALGADLVRPDPMRTMFPISAREIRADLESNWDMLHPVVRAGLHRRVAVIGAESTGTTTLTRNLSQTLDAPLTSEVGRTISWELFAAADSMDSIPWDDEVFWTILHRQARFESEALFAGSAGKPHELGPWLVCDTDSLATVAWWERYLESPSTPAHNYALSRLADFYILTSPEGVAFDDSDPLRDGIAIRQTMHLRLRELLETSGTPFVEVHGPRQQRLDQSIVALRTHEQRTPRWSN
jgi:NadR type nicotinamide-nucleotide adenylyltransferase